MKKIFFIFILCIILISTSGCVTFYEKFESAEEIDNISYIEVYFIEFSYDTYQDNIPESIQPIIILDDELYMEVINDLESLEYKTKLLIFAASDPNFNLYGYVIKVSYQSGVYQLVSNSGTVYTYDINGFVDCFHGTVKDEVWDEFIIKYLGKKTFDKYKLPF